MKLGTLKITGFIRHPKNKDGFCRAVTLYQLREISRAEAEQEKEDFFKANAWACDPWADVVSLWIPNAEHI